MFFCWLLVSLILLHVSEVSSEDCDVADVSCMFKSLQDDIGSLSIKIEQLENKMDQFENKMDQLENKMDQLENKVDTVISEVEPQIKGMEKAVVNDGSNYSRCRLSYLEFGSQLYLTTALHCYLRNLTDDKFKMDFFSTDESPFFDYLGNEAWMDPKSDVLLIKATGLPTGMQALSVDLNNYDCDSFHGGRITCCCELDCKLTETPRVTQVGANFVKVSEDFVRGESGCLCQNKNSTCLFVNSHDGTSNSSPTIGDLKLLQQCMQYQDLDVLDKNKCDSINLKYYQYLQILITHFGVMKLDRFPNDFIKFTEFKEHESDGYQYKSFRVSNSMLDLSRDSTLSYLSPYLTTNSNRHA